MHLFDIYRRLLVLFATVYSLARLAQGITLLVDARGQRTAAGRLARNYLLTLLASVRLGRFRGYFLQIVALLALLGAILYAHGVVMGGW